MSSGKGKHGLIYRSSNTSVDRFFISLILPVFIGILLGLMDADPWFLSWVTVTTGAIWLCMTGFKVTNSVYFDRIEVVERNAIGIPKKKTFPMSKIGAVRLRTEKEDHGDKVIYRDYIDFMPNSVLKNDKLLLKKNHALASIVGGLGRSQVEALQLFADMGKLIVLLRVQQRELEKVRPKGNVRIFGTRPLTLTDRVTDGKMWHKKWRKFRGK